VLRSSWYTVERKSKTTSNYEALSMLSFTDEGEKALENRLVAPPGGRHRRTAVRKLMEDQIKIIETVNGKKNPKESELAGKEKAEKMKKELEDWPVKILDMGKGNVMRFG
jgi:hypothetical protein